VKLAAIVLAGVNAFFYHAYWVRQAQHYDHGGARTPLGARLAGCVSLALWTIVILAGRMISYTLYSR
jgi:hypothetical protein